MNTNATTDLDQDCQIRDWNGLVGHTIKAVINPTGKREVSVILITETGCWMALDATGGSYDEKPIIEIDPPNWGQPEIALSEYLTAADAFHAGLINAPTYELLREKEVAEEKAKNKAMADRLRKQLAALEGDAP